MVHKIGTCNKTDRLAHPCKFCDCPVFMHMHGWESQTLPTIESDSGTSISFGMPYFSVYYQRYQYPLDSLMICSPQPCSFKMCIKVQVSYSHCSHIHLGYGLCVNTDSGNRYCSRIQTHRRIDPFCPLCSKPEYHAYRVFFSLPTLSKLP